MGKVLIFILSLTAEGWLDVLLTTEQGSKNSSPASRRILAQGLQATKSSISSFGQYLNDTSAIKRIHNTSSGNKSSDAGLSPSTPHVLRSARQNPTKTLPNFPSFSTAHGETSKSPVSALLFLASQSSSVSFTNSASFDADVLVAKRYNSYMRRWVVFYVKIGGWIMLAVILCGILSLIFTHIQAKRELRNAIDLPLLTRRERLIAQYKASWI